MKIYTLHLGFRPLWGDLEKCFSVLVTLSINCNFPYRLLVCLLYAMIDLISFNVVDLVFCCLFVVVVCCLVVSLLILRRFIS